jgi:hypothetical protein
MKKIMCLLALAGLIVGCAGTGNNTGGTSDQTEMTSGAYSSGPATEVPPDFYSPATANIYNNPATTPNIINKNSP